jgi:5'-methylthioadenosine phosphorylase
MSRVACADVIGVLTGTGITVIPGLEDVERRRIDTAYGTVDLRIGRVAGATAAHLLRHGAEHERLSAHVEHRANVAAMLEVGVRAVVGTTVCGGVDRRASPGSLIVFDDLYFPSNRLPDGSLCTLFAAGDSDRGHWIFERPFSTDVQAALLEAARSTGLPLLSAGCYGHVDGPRFNSRAEIRALAAAGVTAVSQTAGPEAVLCGEAGLPYCLVGFVTDWANGAAEESTTPAALERLLTEGARALAMVAADAVSRLTGTTPNAAGFVYRLP